MPVPEARHGCASTPRQSQVAPEGGAAAGRAHEPPVAANGMARAPPTARCAHRGAGDPQGTPLPGKPVLVAAESQGGGHDGSIRGNQDSRPRIGTRVADTPLDVGGAYTLSMESTSTPRQGLGLCVGSDAAHARTATEPAVQGAGAASGEHETTFRPHGSGGLDAHLQPAAGAAGDAPLAPGEEQLQMLATLREGLQVHTSHMDVGENEGAVHPDRGEAVLAHAFVDADGRILDLNISDQDSMMYRIESLKLYLEQQLGFGDFISVYRALQASTQSEASDEQRPPLEELLSENAISFLPLVHQLLVCEDHCFK